jgi:large subunit ribosomal protein L21
MMPQAFVDDGAWRAPAPGFGKSPPDVIESRFKPFESVRFPVFGLPNRGFSMHAIIETGGKQFRVAPGDVIRVPKLAGDIGSEIEFAKVLAVFGDAGEVLAGTETTDHKITGTITGNDRAKKVLVFKFKRKKQYKRTIGHRQDYTEVRVGDIVA